MKSKYGASLSQHLDRVGDVHLLCAAHEQTMGEHGTLVAMVCGDVLEVEQLAAIDAGESGLDAVETEDRCHAEMSEEG